MLDAVFDTIARHRMFDPGGTVAVAVSGGADSVCLLHVLRELAPRLGISLSVLHLDHGLRGAESNADAEFVRTLAGQLGLPFLCRRVELSAVEGNLEQAARHARLDFFQERLRSGAASRVALGHTRSDQAETVLFRFLRGSGSAGLAGIRPVTAEGIVRPLIETVREEIVAWLAARGILWREDSSNRDRRFDRNRIRHDLLPQLAREWNPAIVETLAQTAGWALDEEEYWQSHMDRLSAGLFHRRGDAVLIEVRRLREQPAAAARRLLRRAVETVKGDLRGIDFHHIERILALTSSCEGHGRCQAPGIDAMRSFDWLRLGSLEANRSENRDYSIPLAVPGIVPVPLTGTAISLEIVENSETIDKSDYVYNGSVGWVDGALAAGSLQVRNWRPGDRYQPVGETGVHKIKSLFQQARIPLWERRHWPVIAAGEAIVWARRFGPAASLVPGSSSRMVLGIREMPVGYGIETDGGGV